MLGQEQKQRRKMLAEILGKTPPPVTLDEMKEGAEADSEQVDLPMDVGAIEPAGPMGELAAEEVPVRKRLKIRKQLLSK